MGRIRTFIGVKASTGVTRDVADLVSRLQQDGPEYRWVAEDNLHVTLNFVGDVVDVEVPDLCKLIRDSIADESAFQMSIKGVGAFPELDRPRIIWTGVDEGTEALKQLNKTLEDALSHWGVNKDRNEFVPHMTLGRLKRGARWSPELLKSVHHFEDRESGSCRVEKVIVFSSFLDRSGPTYTPMATIPLLD